MKWLAISEWLEKRVSLPVRGAWIEILLQRRVLQDKRESLPVRGAWIEIALHPPGYRLRQWSLPVRGAWIEMLPLPAAADVRAVAPRAGSVD